MGKIVDVEIIPGGMYEDVAETELGPAQHQEVQNLRITRDGAWDVVLGSMDYFDDPLNSSMKRVVEVEEDASGDRFVIIQDGGTLYRIDFDDGDGNGYENETPSALTLPSGVTLSSANTVVFNSFRAIIRITGTSEPLWYGYVDRTLFHGDDSFTVQDWFLKKAEIEWPSGTNDLQLVDAENIPTKDVDTNTDLTAVIYVKFFYVFDGGQYELLKNIDNLISGAAFNFTGLEIEYVVPGRSRAVQLHIRVNGSTLKSNMFNERITGVGLAIVKKDFAPSGVSSDTTQIFNEAVETFQVPLLIPFDEDLGEIAFVVRNAQWDSTANTEIEITDSTNDYYLSKEAGFLGVDVDVEITYNGSSVTTKVASIDYGDTVSTNALLTVDDSLAGIFGATGAKTNVGIKITRKWQYDSSNGYHTYVGVDVDNLGLTYEEFTDIPQGNDNAPADINPNYVYHEVIEDRAYVSGMTGDESDSVRFSPVNQFDVFPNNNIIQTEVGDSDQVQAIAKIDNKLAIIKKKSLSQGNFIGGSYIENIGIVKHGMFPTYGFLVVENLLYVMDRDDVYVFDGINAIALFEQTNSKLRSVYQDNVDSGSFLAFDIINNELIVYTPNKTLVWQRERGPNGWYTRVFSGLSQSLTFQYNNAERQLILGEANKTIQMNHDTAAVYNTSPDEAINWFVTTRVMGRIHWHAKMKELWHHFFINGGDAAFTYTDTEESVSESDSVTTPSTLEGRISRPAHKLVKQLFIKLQKTGSTRGATGEIRRMIMKLEVWK